MVFKKEMLLVAVFVVLLLSSTVLVASVSGQGFFSDILDNIKKWFESSPFGNLLSSPVKSTEEVKLVFRSDELQLEISNPVNITANGSRVMNFRGTLEINKQDNTAMFRQTGSSLVFVQDIGNIRIEGLMLPALDLTNRELQIISGNWNETSQNGSVDIRDFTGVAIITPSQVELDGNVSKLSKG